MRLYYVYILANSHNTVIYIGVTNNLIRRVYEHKNHLAEGFADRYNVEKLVYFKEITDIESAIAYEKRLKGWSRQKKEALIAEKNLGWEDLYDALLQ